MLFTKKKNVFAKFSRISYARSDTESAEDTTAAKDEAKPSEEEAKKEDKKSSAPTVVARMTNLFAAVKKSVKKPKENKYTAETPESEMKVSLRK